MVDIELINNSNFLKQLYPQGIPSNDIILKEANFNYNGPSISISLDMAHKPNVIPKKWTEEFDRISLSLDILGATKVSLSKWGIKNEGKLLLKNVEQGIEFLFLGEDVEISFTSKFIHFKGITPYQSN